MKNKNKDELENVAGLLILSVIYRQDQIIEGNLLSRPALESYLLTQRLVFKMSQGKSWLGSERAIVGVLIKETRIRDVKYFGEMGGIGNKFKAAYNVIQGKEWFFAE